MNKPITPKEMEDWVGGTWDRCQKQAWSDMSISKKVRVRIMQEAYDCADRGEVEAYNSVKVMCSEVLALLDLAVAAEREACAKVCDEVDDGREDLSAKCAEAIRARGEK